MSPRQIDAFEELFPIGNTREPLPFNDRPIISDVDSQQNDDDHGGGQHDGHD